MIYTLTLNPSIDYVVNVNNLTLGKINRTLEDIKFPGGKGINVSRILSNQHVSNVALGFIGGFTGEFVDGRIDGKGVIYMLDGEEIKGEFRSVEFEGSKKIELSNNKTYYYL